MLKNECQRTEIALEKRYFFIHSKNSHLIFIHLLCFQMTKQNKSDLYDSKEYNGQTSDQYK